MTYFTRGLDPPIPLGKPTTCNWCTNPLPKAHTVHGKTYTPTIYKGRDCERYYCSQTCLTSGEDRALRYRAALAGTVHMHWTATLAAALSVLMLAFIVTGGHRAYAHDPATHQANELADAVSDAYGKCCVGDDYTKLRIEEWEPTADGWRVRWHGQWLDVPRRAKVKNMVNPDADAKAWVFGALETTYVRCFLPGALM